MSTRLYTPSPAMQKALAAIAWRTPAVMIKCRKDAARRILAGGDCTYVGHRPLKIAARYARFAAHIRSKQRVKELV
jgi:hypothetical protein